jgi:hypothetical protein
MNEEPMTNEQLRQLDAEADAYQAEANARRDRDFLVCGLQNEVAILRERLSKSDRQRFAWERAAKYEQAARTRLERAITFHKLGTPMSEPMIADLASAMALANDHYAKAEKGEA